MCLCVKAKSDYIYTNPKLVFTAQQTFTFRFCVRKKVLSVKLQPSETRQWNKVQTGPEKRGVCITTSASVLVMATYPEPRPFIAGASGGRLYSACLESNSTGTNYWGEGVKRCIMLFHPPTLSPHLSVISCSCSLQCSVNLTTRDNHLSNHSNLQLQTLQRQPRRQKRSPCGNKSNKRTSTIHVLERWHHGSSHI